METVLLCIVAWTYHAKEILNGGSVDSLEDRRLHPQQLRMEGHVEGGGVVDASARGEE